MTNQFEKLIQFFESIKTISLWQRIFTWRYIRQLSYDAYEEFKLLISFSESDSQKIDELERDNELLKNNNDHLNSTNTSLENEKNEIKNTLEDVNGESSFIKDENTKFRQTEEQSKK